MDGHKILMLTNSELGQATVCLSVAHEFLLRGYDVHVASFSTLRGQVDEMNARAGVLSDEAVAAATFHPVHGLPMMEAYMQRCSADGLPMHPPGFYGALDAFRSKFAQLVGCWGGPEYLRAYESIVAIIKKIQPAIITVDPLFGQAVDACRTLGREFIILSPNTFRDHVFQPWLATLWKFPFTGSGYPFPIPCRLFLLNIYLATQVVKTYRNSPIMKDLTRYRNDHGLSGPLPIFSGLRDSRVPFVLACTLDIDYPCSSTEQYTGCGPILRPFRPIAVESPELAAWLAKAPTVLINLGSHVVYDAENVRQCVEGIRILLDCRSDVQVLWKMKTLAKDNRILDDLVDVSFAERVRIESWLDVDPACILENGNVICMVHHGGANSYNEAVSAGVPHIVLPLWLDTYDFANRVEYHGIGVWGSKTSAPKTNGKELGEAFRRVLASAESETIRTKAQALQNTLPLTPGRVLACEKIIELVGNRAKKTQ
ncbi:UDP-glucoronosyl and UDP-glucosyl transferase family protein [Aspergillus sclerotiicarbonarius CBS 121057]|uniref:UDP-glucoronosyl and UDP-glucosyl transferase family protein n=1 Tax=Aspergillus sclerotiicarbonarius (strain CBS 121057 / IBT 28362) TaxID=1448318 RepID=A0A319ET41_ASPSB|nr:UDP-glucoronosyl and UDP-glucosyl transferase family protein [Aspergillus sclerotiicarbonarius CBS 121057]